MEEATFHMKPISQNILLITWTVTYLCGTAASHSDGAAVTFSLYSTRAAQVFAARVAGSSKVQEEVGAARAHGLHRRKQARAGGTGEAKESRL